MTERSPYELSCPIPKSDYDRVLLAHGGGGRLSKDLIERMFYAALSNNYLRRGHDGAFLHIPREHLAFTTDSFVVTPLFFPGGNIGDLAVNGTVNDLACCGAVPGYLSLSFILEEGLPLEELWEIVKSVGRAAERSGVQIVTGDTKVVEKGKGDGVYINTSGIGEVIPGTAISPGACRPGDVIIINGPIADHGIAILSRREGLEFRTEVTSDTAPLNHMIRAVLEACPSVRVLRDPTRGGVASALNEICDASGTGMTLFEDRLPVGESVRGACEILGFDPLYIANEGKVLIIAPEQDEQTILKVLRSFPEGRGTVPIGRVNGDHPGLLKMRTVLGSERIVEMISGEQLPRIC